MLFEFEVKVIESDPKIKCLHCGKGFKIGSTIITRGHALVENEAYSKKYRIYSGSEGNRVYYHKRCSGK